AETDAAALAKEPIQLPGRLTLRDAFVFALRANKDITVAELGAEADEARIMGAEGEFDATLFMEASRGRTKMPVAGVPVTRTETSDGSASAGVRQRIVTGTDVELTASTDYSRDLTHSSVLNPLYAPGLSLGVSQDLLKNFGVAINRTNIVITQNNWQISEEALRDSLIQNLFQVESAYWDLYFAIADLAVREKQLDRATKLVERAEAQESVGVSAPIEIVRAKSDAASQQVTILQAKNRVSLFRHRLLRLMGIVDVHLVATEFEPADAPSEEMYHTSIAEAVATALRVRPDYVQAELAIENADLQKRFAKNQRLPTLQLFGEFSLTGLDDDFGGSVDDVEDGRYDSWVAGLQFELPIPNRTARSQYQVAQIERRRAKVQLEAVEERITREIADALDVLQTSEGRIVTAQEARQLAESLLKAEEKSFSLGRSDSLDVLNAQSSLASAERDEVRARADYATALANLFRVQGDFLDAKAIPFVGRQERGGRQETVSNAQTGPMLTTPTGDVLPAGLVGGG
ncbi:MAG: TolC family protein, partial [Planctomycetota bacterium]